MSKYDGFVWIFALLVTAGENDTLLLHVAAHQHCEQCTPYVWRQTFVTFWRYLDVKTKGQCHLSHLHDLPISLTQNPCNNTTKAYERFLVDFFFHHNPNNRLRVCLQQVRRIRAWRVITWSWTGSISGATGTRSQTPPRSCATGDLVPSDSMMTSLCVWRHSARKNTNNLTANILSLRYMVVRPTIIHFQLSVYLALVLWRDQVEVFRRCINKLFWLTDTLMSAGIASLVIRAVTSSRTLCH